MPNTSLFHDKSFNPTIVSQVLSAFLRKHFIYSDEANSWLFSNQGKFYIIPKAKMCQLIILILESIDSGSFITNKFVKEVEENLHYRLFSNACTRLFKHPMLLGLVGMDSDGGFRLRHEADAEYRLLWLLTEYKRSNVEAMVNLLYK